MSDAMSSESSTVALWVVLAAIAAFMGYVLVGVRLQIARARRRFLDVPLRAIADCAEGELVRIVGIVEAGERTLLAPSDGAVCVYYRASFHGISYGRGPERRRPPYARHSPARAFQLVAGGERARVTVASVSVATDDESMQDLYAPDRAPARIRKALARALANGVPRGVRPYAFRYEESRLRPGALVTVLGRARWEPIAGATDGGYREGTGTDRVLTIVAPEGDVVRVATSASVRI